MNKLNKRFVTNENTVEQYIDHCNCSCTATCDAYCSANWKVMQESNYKNQLQINTNGYQFLGTK